jgi:hypothetical protein
MCNFFYNNSIKYSNLNIIYNQINNVFLNFSLITCSCSPINKNKETKLIQINLRWLGINLKNWKWALNNEIKKKLNTFFIKIKLNIKIRTWIDNKTNRNNKRKNSRKFKIFKCKFEKNSNEKYTMNIFFIKMIIY